MTEVLKTKRRGRPPATDPGRRRFNLTFRIRGDLKDQIAARAEQSGRSISEEMEFLLEDYNYKNHIIKLKDEQIDRLITSSERYETAYREMSSRVYEVDRVKSTAISSVLSMFKGIFIKAMDEKESVTAKDVRNLRIFFEMMSNIFPIHDLNSYPEGVDKKGFKEQTIVNLATIHKPDTINKFFTDFAAYTNDEKIMNGVVLSLNERFEEIPAALREKLIEKYKESAEEFYGLFCITKVLHEGLS